MNKTKTDMDSSLKSEELKEAGSLRTGIDGEASLAEARRLIGVDHRGARTTIEITDDNVRDYCSYIDSSNPLFLDPAYGRSSRWGRSIAPPTMIGTAIIAPGLKGVQWIYGGARWRFHKPFGPGDLIAQSGTLVGAEIKSGRTAAQMIVQKGLTQCVNQRGELVAETQVVCRFVGRPASSMASKSASPDRLRRYAAARSATGMMFRSVMPCLRQSSGHFDCRILP
jgi:acyl dehydratase